MAARRYVELMLLLLSGMSLTLPQRAQAAPWHDRTRFASPRFEQVWRRADQAVAEADTERSWTWGPSAWFDYYEFYKQSPNGLRLVQYFDKARMEINNPSTSGGSLGGVTNGLLPVEMVSGRIKLGDGTGPDQNEQREPPDIPVAGDQANENPSAPTYRSFRSVATTDNGYRDPSKIGHRVGTTFTKSGTIGFNQDLANMAGTEIVVYETVTGHNVPRVFEEFRNAGPIPALETFGLPITDPYWIVARVGTQGVVAGQDRDILVQIYERRVLTYTPSNPRAFQVEMGNVGQHYFQWRYPHLSGLGQPWQLPSSNYYFFGGIFFASNRDSTHLRLFKTEADEPYSSAQYATGDDPQETVPFSQLRSWGLSEHFVFGASKRYGGKLQLISQRTAHSPSPLPEYAINRILTSEANDFHPAVSPDGTKVAFASDRDGNVDLYLLNLRGGDVEVTSAPIRLTETTGCANQHPSWLPDGTGLVYESNCQGGNWEIYRAGLSYTMDTKERLELARQISPGSQQTTRLTNNAADDRFPRVSPDGAMIALTALHDSNPEIYLMKNDGSGVVRLTNSVGVDQGATWSHDGTRLAFSSNRDGDFEVFVMNRDGSGLRQITQNSAEDGYTVWAQ